jgi:hypothetical protein
MLSLLLTILGRSGKSMNNVYKILSGKSGEREVKNCKNQELLPPS